MRHYSKQALLYFPTTVLFVDDDPMFLSNIGFKIDKRIPIELCNKPQKSLELLRSTSLVDDVIQKLFTNLDDDGDINMDLLFKNTIKKIHTEIYNEDRFTYISAVVIDYSMPNINGVELCKRIADIPTKKIMLTGEADHVTAVQLFNDGLIDSFIVKDSSKMAEELGAAIEKAQLAYFERVSAGLLDSLLGISPIFANDKFSQHFQQVFRRSESLEYYILDVSGSFLFVDDAGKSTWMIVKSDEEIESYYDIAVDQDAPQDIIRSLKERSMIPFFFTESDQKLPASKWLSYLHQAKKINGLEGHYYTVIKDNPIYRLEAENIFSHRDYLRKQV